MTTTDKLKPFIYQCY